MSAIIAYIIEGVCYVGLVAAMGAIVWEAWQQARKREDASSRTTCGDMYEGEENDARPNRV